MITVPVEQYMKDLSNFNWSFLYHRLATPDTNTEMIKANPSLLDGWSIYNNAAYAIYVKLFNTSVVTAPGANKVHKTIGVAANSASHVDLSSGLLFDRGICIAIVKGIADSDATILVANDCVVDLHYR